MIGTLIQILFLIIILGVLWWAITQLLPLIPLPPPFATIVYVLMVVIFVLVVLWIIWQLIVASGLVSGKPFRIGGEPDRAVATISARAATDLPRLLG